MFADLKSLGLTFKETLQHNSYLDRLGLPVCSVLKLDIKPLECRQLEFNLIYVGYHI